MAERPSPEPAEPARAVAVLLPLPLAGTYDYAVPDGLEVAPGDVVLVPKGYHPCAACHGYDLYYLNVMAGPKRTWKFHNAPEHEWLMQRA